MRSIEKEGSGFEATPPLQGLLSPMETLFQVGADAYRRRAVAPERLSFLCPIQAHQQSNQHNQSQYQHLSGHDILLFVKKENIDTRDRKRSSRREVTPHRPLQRAITNIRRHAGKSLALLLAGSLTVISDGSNVTKADEQSSKAFRLGPWNFIFQNDTPESLQAAIHRIFIEAAPHVNQLLGAPSEVFAGQWTVRTDYAGGAMEHFGRRELRIAPDTSDALRIHELVHMFQGPDFPEINWVREGTAVALSNMVTDRMGIPRWDASIDDLAIGTNLHENLGVAPRFPYEQVPAIYPLRYYWAGRFWETVFATDPEALVSMSREIRAFYRKPGFGNKSEVEDALNSMPPYIFLKTFLGGQADLIDFSNPIFNFRGPEDTPTRLTYGYVARLDGAFQLRIAAVVRLPDSAETPLSTYGNGTMVHTATKQEHRFLFRSSGASGSGAVVEGLEDFIRQTGRSGQYTIVITAQDCQPEHISFSLP